MIAVILILLVLILVGLVFGTNHKDLQYKGLKGDMGDKGDTGNSGTNGTNGVKGVTGDAGPMGAVGAKGVTGDAGAKGATGDTGAQGAKGVTGDTGAAGAQGITSAKANTYAFSNYMSVDSTLPSGYNYQPSYDNNTTASSQFNSQTGVFTAPLDGMYYFEADMAISVKAATSTNFRLAMSRNNAGTVSEIEGDTYAFPDSTSRTASLIVTLHLRGYADLIAGDTVSVKLNNNGPDNITVLGVNHENRFKGFLVRDRTV